MAGITIDLTNRLFIETGSVVDGDTSWDIQQDFYLPWKALLRADFQNLGYPQAMRYVGLDPISPIQDLGVTYFMMNRFRFRPGEWDHEVELVGNLFADPFDNPLILPTLGGYTVLVKQRVSNLVDSSVARLDLNQLLQAIYVDTVNGVPGTGTENGTPTNPVDNLNDAVTLLAARKLNRIVFSGTLALNQNFSSIEFEGTGFHGNNEVQLGGYDVDRCSFRNCGLSGTMSGRIEATNCELMILAGLDGEFERCHLSANFSLANNGALVFRDCTTSTNGPSDAVDVTLGTNTNVQFRNFSGALRLESYDASNLASLDLDPGTIELGATCTGGVLQVRGLGNVIRNDGGAVTLSDAGMVYGGQLVLSKDAAGPDTWTQDLP